MDNVMNFHQLPPVTIINGLVHNEPASNYELYLMELVNKSSWFSSTYPGGFRQPKSEDNGECDAINPQYELDFKLFESTTMLQGRSIYSEQFYSLHDGITAIGLCKKPGGQTKGYYLHTAFREMTDAKLAEFASSHTKRQGLEKDIENALKIQTVQKNLMLFYPYDFTFDNPITKEEAISNIAKGISHDFHLLFSYRKEKAPHKDTFWVCMYNQEFLIFEIQDCSLLYRDSVSASALPTYQKLISYGDY